MAAVANYSLTANRVRVAPGVSVQVRAHTASDAPTWRIVKRYRLNPLTGQDQDYSPDYYADMIRKGSIEGAKIQNWHSEDGVRVRAIQTMLHLQTNYNVLLMQGLYRQEFTVVKTALLQWYQEIARRFPRYRDTCEFEYARHLRRYLSGLGHDFHYVRR